MENMNSTSPLFYSDLERHIRCDKRLTFHLAGHSLELDLSFKHERAYAAKLMLNLRHPQFDLDEFLFKRFVKPGDTVLDAGRKYWIYSVADALGWGKQSYRFGTRTRTL